MDKLRRRAKQHRRAERIKARIEEDRKLAEEFNEKCRKEGMHHNFSPRDVRRAYERVKKETMHQAIVYSNIAVIWAMRKRCGYGNRRLWNIAARIMSNINAVGKQERSVKQMYDDLISDAKIDCNDYWRDANIRQDISLVERERIYTVMEGAKEMFPMQIYAVYYELYRKTQARKPALLDDIVRLAVNALQDGIECGTMDVYIADLEKCGFHMSVNGWFEGKNTTDEEYKKLQKMLD